MAVQLDMGDVVHVAVRRQDSILVLAAEQRDLDLLTLVLVRVILHASERSAFGLPKRIPLAVYAPSIAARVGRP